MQKSNYKGDNEKQRQFILDCITETNDKKLISVIYYVLSGYAASKK